MPSYMVALEELDLHRKLFLSVLVKNKIPDETKNGRVQIYEVSALQAFQWHPWDQNVMYRRVDYTLSDMFNRQQARKAGS